MKSEQTWMQKYKKWIKRTFPGKTAKEIEKWDFIMVFEERYKDEMEAYFHKYMDGVT